MKAEKNANKTESTWKHFYSGRGQGYRLKKLAKMSLEQAVAANEEQAKAAEDLMGLLTPIGKAFVTETGYEAANIGVQVYGGHGFIKEWGMEQIVRDARISMLYEGTTGIQALDLLGRKVTMKQGAAFACVLVDTVTEFGKYLKVPLRM